MARPPNPNGKDKLRTISLDGDVSDIAQSLADRGMLSREISQFLRDKYGHSSELDKMKAKLHDLVNARKNLQAEEEELINLIDEQARLHNERIQHDYANAQAVARKDFKMVTTKIANIESRLKYGIADETQKQLAIKELSRFQETLAQLEKTWGAELYDTEC